MFPRSSFNFCRLACTVHLLSMVFPSPALFILSITIEFPERIEVPLKHDSKLNHPGFMIHKHERVNTDECIHKMIKGLRIAGPFTRSYSCPVGYLKCALQRQCYDERYACDGYIDCLDGSDEAECGKYTKCLDVHVHISRWLNLQSRHNFWPSAITCLNEPVCLLCKCTCYFLNWNLTSYQYWSAGPD